MLNCKKDLRERHGHKNVADYFGYGENESVSGPCDAVRICGKERRMVQ